MSRGFTGHEHEDELGLINMRGRIYDPQVGRFLSADSRLNTGGGQDLNPYSYVTNNPLRYTDPSGFQASEESSTTPIAAQPPAGLGGSTTVTVEGPQSRTPPAIPGRSCSGTCGGGSDSGWGSIVADDSGNRQLRKPGTPVTPPRRGQAEEQVPSPPSESDLVLRGDELSGQARSPKPTRPNDAQTPRLKPDKQERVFIFKTAGQAARAALRGINPTSIREEREYGGYIIAKIVDGRLRYGFTAAQRMGKSGGDIGSPPTGARIVADYHTHGDPDSGFVNEHFSPRDRKTSIVNPYTNGQLRSFLMTPGNRILLFEPSTESVFEFRNGEWRSTTPPRVMIPPLR
jgi:RHS repeat-associated protein